MSNNGGLSRDALIEKVERAWLELGYEDTDIDGALTEEGTALYAATAVDVAAKAIAADLEAQSEPHWDAWMKSEGLAAHRHAQTWTTYRAAADRVRGLLGKDKTEDCPDDLMARLRESFGLLAGKDKTNE